MSVYVNIFIISVKPSILPQETKHIQIETVKHQSKILKHHFLDPDTEQFHWLNKSWKWHFISI